MTQPDEAANPTPQPERGFFRPFWRGLTEPTKFSLYARLAFAALEFCVWAAVVTPRAVAKLPPTFFKVKPADDYARATVDALRLKYSQIEGQQVALLGASTTRLAFRDTDDIDRISEALTREVGEPVTAWNLTANNEQPEEYLILSDYLPKDFHGVVIAGVSDNGRDTHAERVNGKRRRRTKERLALDAPSLGKEARALGEAPDARTGVYFFDHLGFFAARRDVLFRLGGGPARDAPPLNERISEKKWPKLKREVQRDGMKPNVLSSNLKLIERFAKTLAKRKIRLVLLETPINPRFEALKKKWREGYTERITALAERTGASYWNVSEEAHIATSDFADASHLGANAARERFQKVVLARLAVMLRETH